MAQYIYIFNSEFAVEPQDAESMFIRPDKSLNLDYILCIKQQRTIDSGGVVSYGGKAFKVVETVCSGMIPPHAKVNMLVSPDFGIKIEYRNIVFDVCPYIPAKRAKAKPKAEKKAVVPRPVPDEHYYKYGQQLAPKLDFTDTRDEILGMLNDLFLRKYA